MGLHGDSALLHALDLLLVAGLLRLLLFPDSVSDLCHDFVLLFELLLLILLLALLMSLQLFVVEVLLLLHYAILEPVFKLLMALFLLFDFLKALDLFSSEFVALFEHGGEVFVLLPGVHGVGSVLVLLILLCLFLNKLFVKVLLRLVDQFALQLFLVLLLTHPHLVVQIPLFSACERVSLNKFAIEFPHCTLLIPSIVLNLLVVFVTILCLLLDVTLSDLVKSFEQLFVSKVLSLLLIHIEVIAVQVFLIIRVLIASFDASQVSQVLVALL